MNSSEKQVIWKRFLNESLSSRPRLHSLLCTSSVLDDENGCKVCIQVASLAQEQWLSEKGLGQIVSALENPKADYEALVPISFVFQREDGTVVDAVVTISEPQTQKQDTRSFAYTPIHIMSREESVSQSVSEETSRFLSELNDFANSTSHASDTDNCREELRTLLTEIINAGQNAASYDTVNHFLTNIQKPLQKVSKELGKESDYYIKISNLIVNSASNLVIKIVNSKQDYSNVQQALSRFEYLDSFPMSKNTRERFNLNKSKLKEIESRINYNLSYGYTSEGKLRLSERIERFARRIYSVESGGKRYTSPLLGWVALPFFIIAWIVAIFDKK